LSFLEIYVTRKGSILQLIRINDKLPSVNAVDIDAVVAAAVAVVTAAVVVVAANSFVQL